MMLPRDRYKPHLAPTASPRFRYGSVVMDEARGEVVVVGITAGKIPWPIGKRGRAKSPVLYGDLAKAVQREANLAVCHWWGITGQTVTKWRKALGVDRTEGTTKLFRANAAEEGCRLGLKKAQAKARDPERCAKIAAARRGRKMPKALFRKLVALRKGSRMSDEARRKMSEAQRRRGARPPKAGVPWTAQEDGWLRTLPTAEVVRRTGRTKMAVYNRRCHRELAGREDEGRR